MLTSLDRGLDFSAWKVMCVCVGGWMGVCGDFVDVILFGEVCVWRHLIGCLWVWNCACNGLMPKVCFRFEGIVCQVRIIITYLRTHTHAQTHTPLQQTPPLQKANERGQQQRGKGRWKTVISFFLLRTKCMLSNSIHLPQSLLCYHLMSLFNLCARWPYCIQNLAGRKVFVQSAVSS